MKRKILVLIKGLGLGGAERLLMDSLPFFDRARFEYHVGYLLPWKQLLVRDLERTGIPVHCLGAAPLSGAAARGSWLGAALLPGALRRLRALQQRERFDLIQADLPVAGILARVMSSIVPVVYTEHSVQERYHPLTRWVNAKTYGRNRRVVAVSNEVAASIERFGMSRCTRIVTLPNGVPIDSIRSEAGSPSLLRAELNIPDTHMVIGTVAGLRREKRLDHWLEVAARIAARRSDVTFVIVGGGPLEREIRARVEMLGLTRAVRMPGFRLDGRRFMGAMDVYLMTSAYEGLPIALLEAMALGKPVVSTPVGGIPEVLQSGRTGLLAPVGAIDDLADCVIRLLDDPALRVRMGQEAAANIERHHHVRDRVRAIERLYDEVLADVPGAVTH
jgi:glycosyltransferase involved in cell wall biosynthesis